MVGPLYHGSPHQFEKFDISKIGTGEGAQAYGHGLYFAENPNVALSYKPLGRSYYTVQGARYDAPVGSPHERALRELADQRDAKAVLRMVRERREQNMDPGFGHDPKTYWPEVERYVRRYMDSPVKRVTEKVGATYKVSLKAEPEDFLDWDKPLTQQSEKVKAGLKKLGLNLEPYERYNKITGRLDEISQRPAAEHAAHPEWTKEWDALQAERRQLLREMPGTGMGTRELTGEGLYGTLSAQGGGSEAGRITAESLRDAGIKGVRYFDQGSRAIGKGTHNYVVFEDDIIDLLESGAISKDVALKMLAGSTAVGAAGLTGAALSSRRKR